MHSGPRISILINSRLNQYQDDAICSYIDRLSAAYLPPRKDLVVMYAQSILDQAAEGTGTPVPRLNTKWLSRWLDRNPNYHSTKMQTIDRKRLLAADGDSIAEWFNELKRVRDQYAIQPTDIWNMDESGFAIAAGHNQTVIAPVDDFRRNTYKPKLGIAENRELVTVIEGISASGNYIEPFIIFKDINHVGTMYGDGRHGPIEGIEGMQVPVSWHDNWTFATSPTGFTNDVLGFEWIQHFHAESVSKQVGEYRLLLVDGHGSHSTKELLDFCESKKIIVFGFPPHSTHLLQPCDVGLFGPYKQHFTTAVNDAVRLGYTQFGKQEFTNLMAIARSKTMKGSTIMHDFKNAGIEPLNAQIPIQLALKSLPPRPQTPPPRDIEVPATPVTVRRTEKLGLWLHNECFTRFHAPDFDVDRYVQFLEIYLKGTIRQSYDLRATMMALCNTKASQEAQRRAQSVKQYLIQRGGILKGEFARSVVRAKQDQATLADQRRADRTAKKAAENAAILSAMDQTE